MKQIIYLTRSKVWFDGTPFDWRPGNLTEVLKVNRQKINTSDVRIVLGNEVSYLCAFPQKKGEIFTREIVAEEIKNHLPIEIGTENFDWTMTLRGKEVWAQAVAVEESLLEEISKAVMENGLKVNLMIPVGVLLGRVSADKKTPILIKWMGTENLTVLATQNLVDSVYTAVPDEQIANFAKSKWALETEPEVIQLSETNYNLSEWAFAEKNRGPDTEVLNLSLFRNLKPNEEAVVEEKIDRWQTPALIIVIILIILGLIWFFGDWGKMVVTSRTETVAVGAVTETPTPTVAIEQSELDLTKYTVQVLNSTDVNGVSAGIRDILTMAGWGKIDIGNAPPTTKSLVRVKTGLSELIGEKIKNSLSDYDLIEGESLPVDNQYDVVIVIGGVAI